MNATWWEWKLAILVFVPLVTVLLLKNELTEKKQKRLLFLFMVIMIAEIIIWKKWM